SSKRDWSSDVCSSDLNLRFLNDGSRIFVITQRYKLGMTKPIGSRPLQEFHLNDSFGTQPNALLHLLSRQVITPTRLVRVGQIGEIGRASCREGGGWKV